MPIFSYNPRTPSPRCKQCGDIYTTICSYKLTGASFGQTCDRKLCARCAVTIDTDDYCAPHAKRLCDEIETTIAITKTANDKDQAT